MGFTLIGRRRRKASSTRSSAPVCRVPQASAFGRQLIRCSGSVLLRRLCWSLEPFVDRCGERGVKKAGDPAESWRKRWASAPAARWGCKGTPARPGHPAGRQSIAVAPLVNGAEARIVRRARSRVRPLQSLARAARKGLLCPGRVLHTSLADIGQAADSRGAVRKRAGNLEELAPRQVGELAQ